MSQTKLQIKAVFFGPTGSGKTGLLQRITSNTFTAASHHHNADIQIKNYSSQRSHIDYSLWETPGEQEFTMQRNVWFQHSDLGIYCINLAQPIEPQLQIYFIEQFKNINPNSSVIVVGTKSEYLSEEQQAQYIQPLKQFCKKHQLSFILTSAEKNIHIRELKLQMDKFSIHQLKCKKINQFSIMLNILSQDIYNTAKEHYTQQEQQFIFDTLEHFKKNILQINLSKQKRISVIEKLHHQLLDYKQNNQLLMNLMTSLCIAACSFAFILTIGFTTALLFGVWSTPYVFFNALMSKSDLAMSLTCGNCLISGAVGIYHFYHQSQTPPLKYKLISLENRVDDFNESLHSLNPLPI
jgi:GTPase SAR1 family protein